MRNIAATADSSECVSLAKSWLQECMNDHDDKCGQCSPGLLPDRTIYVVPDREPCIFRNSNKTIASYATLSHHWGWNIQLRLTCVNLNEFTDEIPLVEFPKTFRDATKVCKMLEIECLWIDSLCIVQDSIQDWNKRAAKMISVYSDAILTIAADAAENSEAGFLTGTREVTGHRTLLLSLEYQIFARPRSKLSCDTGFMIDH